MKKFSYLLLAVLFLFSASCEGMKKTLDDYNEAAAAKAEKDQASSKIEADETLIQIIRDLIARDDISQELRDQLIAALEVYSISKVKK